MRVLEGCWKLFQTGLRKVQINVFKKQSSNYGKRGRRLWVNKKALTNMKKKSESYRKYCLSDEGKDYWSYAQSRNQVRWECIKSKRDFERQLAREAKKNPKGFYNYASCKGNTREGIANLDIEKKCCD